MMRRDLVAYGLIGLGVLALLARVSGGAGWLWIALVAGALLATYVSQRTYGLLVVGGLLAGTSVGLLLQQLFPRCDGVFLVSLGAGLIAIDLVERREPRWPRSVGLALAALGLVLVLATSGILGSAWFALLLIAIGAAVLWRGREASAFPPPRVDVPTPRAQASGPADAGDTTSVGAPSVDAASAETTAGAEAVGENPESGADATVPPSESR
ncbi:MAG: hypothetical protein ACNA8N_06795 [Trueperaceae bacterium]